jgi:WD40 repeat protein
MDGMSGRSGSSVFVSYAREDESFVRRMAEELSARQHRAWIDRIDMHPFDPDWVASVKSAIDACSTFLVVISPDSVVSDACAAELAHAVAHNKRVAPLLYRDVGDDVRARMSPVLARPNWFLFRDADDFDVSMRRLVRAIDTDLDSVAVHARLLVRARDWERKLAGTLTMAELLEAERWLAEAASKEPVPLPLHASFIRASREAADRDLARTLLTHAEREARGAARNLPVSVLLAIESHRLTPSAEAEHAVRRGLLLGRPVRVLREPSAGKPAWAGCEISPDGRLVAIPGRESLQVVETSTGQTVCSLTLAAGVDRVRFSHQGRYLATWGNVKHRTEDDPFPSGPLEVFRLPDGKRVAVCTTSDVMALAYSPDERYLAAGGYDRRAIVIDLEKDSVTPLAHEKSTNALAFHPNGRLLAAQAGEHLWIWSFPDCRIRRRLPCRFATMLQFSQNGYYLLSGQHYQRGDLQLWTADERWWRGWKVRPGPKLTLPEKITAIAYHSFSWAQFAAATDDGSVRVCWAGRSNTEPLRIDEQYRITHERRVADLSFRVSDDTRSTMPSMATASDDATVREWLHLDEIARMVHSSAVEAVRYTADGRHLVTVTVDGGVYVWESNWLAEHEAIKDVGRDDKRQDETLPWFADRGTLHGDALIDEVCRRLPRNLTIEEWRSVFGDAPYRPTCAPSTS